MRISFQSITVFPAMSVPLDGNDLKLLSPGFVVALGGKVGAKPRKKCKWHRNMFLKLRKIQFIDHFPCGLRYPCGSKVNSVNLLAA